MSSFVARSATKSTQRTFNQHLPSRIVRRILLSIDRSLHCGISNIVLSWSSVKGELHYSPVNGAIYVFTNSTPVRCIDSLSIQERCHEETCTFDVLSYDVNHIGTRADHCADPYLPGSCKSLGVRGNDSVSWLGRYVFLRQSCDYGGVRQHLVICHPASGRCSDLDIDRRLERLRRGAGAAGPMRR